MHLEILVEGSSEKRALVVLLRKIFSEQDGLTFAIHHHRGNGKLPDDPRARPNSKDPTLLHNLPSKLRAYGKALDPAKDAVVVLVDLDDHIDCTEFKQELLNLLKACPQKPRVIFRIAIEELEAWYFGDRQAILTAYPRAKLVELNSYVQDSQCGTWEKLAESVVPGGLRTIKSKGRSAGVREKVEWAKKITPHMDVDKNISPSFEAFRDGLRQLIKDLK